MPSDVTRPILLQPMTFLSLNFMVLTRTRNENNDVQAREKFFGDLANAQIC